MLYDCTLLKVYSTFLLIRSIDSSLSKQVFSPRTPGPNTQSYLSQLVLEYELLHHNNVRIKACPQALNGTKVIPHDNLPRTLNLWTY